MRPFCYLLAAAALTGSLAAPLTALAQGYPSAPVKMIIPSAPGGLSDPVVRFLGEHFQKVFGQPLVMEHRAGGGGIIGTQLVSKAAPDGYTLLLGNIGPLVFAPALNPKVPYSVKDLAPVGSLLTFGNVVLVNPAFGATDIQQLVQLARQKPGTINFASAGNGQSQHLTGELFKRAAGVDIVHVPYKGTGPAMTDLIGGQVQLMFGNIPAALPFIKSGQLRAIAVTSAKRSAALPNVPTVQESGVPGFVVESFVVVMAPAGTPRPVVQRLNEEMHKAWQTPEGQKLLAELNIDANRYSPEEIAAFLENDSGRWTKVIREANVKAE
ncbi:MAG: putative Bug-like extra-cytoplasmic solute receptor, family [Ramlibacter sp.]|nr:putative Bug-like extra-cytoplasmic solute receptor, family [Ramlibacter sp.]